MEGDLRLVGGQNEFEGRVEICLNSVWGTVCDNFWSSIIAGVVCRQLGYATDGLIIIINDKVLTCHLFSCKVGYFERAVLTTAKMGYTELM